MYSNRFAASRVSTVAGAALLATTLVFLADNAFFGARRVLFFGLVLSTAGALIANEAAELPSTFMYSYTFTRNQMGVGSTSAVIMLIAAAGSTSGN